MREDDVTEVVAMMVYRFVNNKSVYRLEIYRQKVQSISFYQPVPQNLRASGENLLHHLAALQTCESNPPAAADDGEVFVIKAEQV